MFVEVKFFKSFETLKNSLKEGKYLLLVAEKSDFSIDMIPDTAPIVGAVFPRLIFDNKSYESGYILAKMTENTSAFLVEDMENHLYIDGLDKLNSFFLIVDGLSSKINTFVENFFEEVQEECKIIGGGAGKLTLTQEPIIFTNKVILEDAALVIGSYEYVGVGVKHGWEEVKGPFIATDTDKCVLKKINYMDAFKLYKDVVEKDSGKVFTDENFFDIAKAYPFGVTRYSREVVVRDPITTDGHSMMLVGEMDRNSIISILKGNKNNLISAASEAAKSAISNLKVKKQSQALLVDCISRFLFLEDQFEEELEGIKDSFSSSDLLWGILTLGEIANANQENIEFYNKTCVVGAL